MILPMSENDTERERLWARWHADDSPNEIREEWEVASDNPGGGFPPYRFVFGNPGESRFGEEDSTPESRARDFIATVEKHGGWPDPPRLRSRTVITSSWKDERP